MIKSWMSCPFPVKERMFSRAKLSGVLLQLEVVKADGASWASTL